jgi:hypothetical protein
MGEKRIDTAVYVAPCEQRNPIELYENPKGYGRNCVSHGNQATFKLLFLSPKHEVEGDFGPKYFCNQCVPDIHKVASSQDNYLDIFYGLFNRRD